jgi:hypothetical protein
MNDEIRLSYSELKKIKLTPNQLKLTIYIIDYYMAREKQEPRGLIKLRNKCEELLGYKVITT